MAFFWIIAFFTGVCAVLQSGLQKKFADETGLATSLHISNLVVLFGGLAVLTIITLSSSGEYAQLLKPKNDVRIWSWWLILPGLCGLFLVSVSPFLIMKIGALNLFVAMVFGQIVASALWDKFVEGTPMDYWRLGGAFLVLSGTAAISMSKQ